MTLNPPALRNRGFAPPCYSVAIFADSRLVDVIYFEAASEAESLAVATAYFDTAIDAKFDALRAALA